MKLTKKIACAVLSAAMTLTSVAALAVTPTPKTVIEGLNTARNYINDGLYYEAVSELHKIESANKVSDPYNRQQWDLLYNDAMCGIGKWEVSEALRRVSEAYAANDVFEAREQLLSVMTTLGIYSAVPGSATSNGIYGVANGVGEDLNDPWLGMPIVKLNSDETSATAPTYFAFPASTAGTGLNGTWSWPNANNTPYNLDYATTLEFLNWAQVLDSIDTPAQAIVAAERASGTYLSLPNYEYQVTRFADGDNGWDVYVVDKVTGATVECYHVFANIPNTYATGMIRTAPVIGNWANAVANPPRGFWNGPTDATQTYCDVVWDN